MRIRMNLVGAARPPTSVGSAELTDAGRSNAGFSAIRNNDIAAGLEECEARVAATIRAAVFITEPIVRGTHAKGERPPLSFSPDRLGQP